MRNMHRFFQRFLLAATLGVLSTVAVAQESEQATEYARGVLDTLCSNTMFGRGYLNQGQEKAAEYLSNEYTRLGLKPFRTNYFQEFQFSINTFPSALSITVNGTALVPGEDFIAHAPSGTCFGTFPVVRVGKKSFLKKSSLKKLQATDLPTHFVVADDAGVTDEQEAKAFKAMPLNPLRARGVVLVQDKLTATLSQQMYAHPVLEVKRGALPKKFDSLTVEVEAGLLNVVGRNVIGYVEGTEHPDSFLVFTAHYDHLGGQGSEIFFPGANDNASGTAMLLSLARHYTKHPHRYSMAFIATAGEEVGLLGSKHFVDNPLFPIENIAFLLNFDILGTGDDGIKVVNATEFVPQFERLVKLNEENRWLAQISKRGKAAISDHYFFTEQGVPCFYWYTLGGIAHYHNVFDKAETLPLNEFEDVFRLAVAFMDGF